MMMRKRGQAALEFLTTYGWAFLVILVMIGALAYFGVLDPTRFIPQRCQFGQELYCERFALQQTGVVGGANGATFQLRNNLQDTLYIADIEYATDDAPSTFTSCANSYGKLSTAAGNPAALPAGGLAVPRSNSVVLVCEDNGFGLLDGEKVRIHFKALYSQGGAAYDATFGSVIYGEVFANVN